MKKISQISVFVENTRGRIAEVLTQIGKIGVDIKAMSIADTSDYGILRLITKNVENDIQLLKQVGLVCKTTDVISIDMEDKPGGLATIVSDVSSHGIDIQYLYAFFDSASKKPFVIIKTSDVEGDMKKLEG